MDIVTGIRRLGFRKWYERRLIEAHAYLITGFLALILALACVEVAGDAGQGLRRLAWLIGAAASLGGGVLAWLRYHRVLLATETVAERAVCPGCGAYGRFRVVRSAPHSGAELEAAPALEDLPHLRVRCRDCQREWDLDPPL
jgi:hypothetical protein